MGGVDEALEEGSRVTGLVLEKLGQPSCQSRIAHSQIHLSQLAPREAGMLLFNSLHSLHNHNFIRLVVFNNAINLWPAIVSSNLGARMWLAYDACRLA